MKKKPRHTLPTAPLLVTPVEEKITMPGPAIATAPSRRLVMPGDVDSRADDGPVDPELQAANRKRAAAAQYTWAGAPLRPFSKSRQRLFNDIRSAAGAGAIGSDGAMETDPPRFLWLCLLPDDQMESVGYGLGLPGPASVSITLRLQRAIDLWADENAALLRAHRTDAMRIFTSAWIDTISTAAIPQSNESAADDAGN